MRSSPKRALKTTCSKGLWRHWTQSSLRPESASQCDRLLPRRNPTRLDGRLFGRKGDDRIASATYFVTLVDFTEVGEMAVFIDEEQLAALERRMRERGYLEAQDMATAFNMLRANDLIWSFVVNNYLLGKEHMPVDLLFWNSDSTRMPAAMHSFYLRKMYQQNLLAKPGGITLADTPIDLSKIQDADLHSVYARRPIAPWKSTYAATHLYSGPVKFVLSASGHMAGVISGQAANTVIGRTTICRQARTNGSLTPRLIEGHGGRSGTNG